MPVFTKQLEKVHSEPRLALKQMENHIRYIQEQLEYTLNNLDSSNIREIETDKTEIKNSDGSMNLTGDLISLSGPNGELFKAGIDATKKFVFEVKGKNGVQYMHINGNGDMVITKNATLSIDCGEW